MSPSLVAENVPVAIYKSLTGAVILIHLKIKSPIFCVFLTAFKAKPSVLEIATTLNIG